MDIYTVDDHGDIVAGARFKLVNSGAFGEHFIKSSVEAPAGVAQNQSIGVSNDLLLSQDAIVFATGHHQEVMIRRASVSLNRRHDGQMLVPQAEPTEKTVPAALLWVPHQSCALGIEDDPSCKFPDVGSWRIRQATLIPGLIRLPQGWWLRVNVSYRSKEHVDSRFKLGFDGKQVLRFDGKPAATEELLWV